MKTTLRLSCCAAVLFGLSLTYGESTTTGTEAVSRASPETMRKSLRNFKSKLTSTYKNYSPRDLSSINSYMTALARIEVCSRFIMENFNKNEGRGIIKYIGTSGVENQARDMFEACSLLTEIALVQMKTNELDGSLLAATRISDSLHNELNKVYGAIADLERGRATELKSLLKEESAKLAAQRKEAERRFKKLQSKLIKVRKDARGTIISVSDLLFAFDKADLTADLKTALAKIAGILLVYKNCTVTVEGHTDNVGTAKYNKRLSTRRASNVKDFLVAQGVKASRLSAVGYGFKRPVATNKTKEGRQKNRRVDLVVVDKKK